MGELVEVNQDGFYYAMDELLTHSQALQFKLKFTQQ